MVGKRPEPCAAGALGGVWIYGTESDAESPLGVLLYHGGSGCTLKRTCACHYPSLLSSLHHPLRRVPTRMMEEAGDEGL